MRTPIGWDRTSITFKHSARSRARTLSARQFQYRLNTWRASSEKGTGAAECGALSAKCFSMLLLSSSSGMSHSITPDVNLDMSTWLS